MGLLSVVLSVISTYGICSAFGLVFSPMHSIIPFLMLGKMLNVPLNLRYQFHDYFFELGIGIDDMFVIVQCLSNIEENDPTFNERPIEILIGETMKHAGVAITITSITDLVVFGVGAITVSLKEKKIVK